MLRARQIKVTAWETLDAIRCRSFAIPQPSLCDRDGRRKMEMQIFHGPRDHKTPLYGHI